MQSDETDPIQLMWTMGTRITDKEIILTKSPLPVEGQIWQHYKGERYEVVGTAFTEADCTEMVIYFLEPNGNWWVRPLSEFVTKFTLLVDNDP